MSRRTKIICTIGPATADVEKLVELIQNGMEIARLNFSHGTHQQHQEMFANIRRAEEISGKPIAVMQDLQGPKIRTRNVRNGIVFLSPGSEFIITAD
ncbi:MAG TPA: pyruvate kinase, partial [Candidatus Kapabacteria bacterium]|nr:pyruvate kinase [Candidatus Kapabacteria bacterium]